ncbi:NAD+ diphosphatase [Hasllibacter halocynthiae]|uniref:NAD(+) diphosphatase n=1 Tax=Hasllibacter halocynthiae TaxID=595589 RepID=A0A2T0X418_9RHOB|nr:NAD(+) diphosphatase [Hasllibacter halocynthiae]PRY93680.1 NAD+ diphosphatase [Hasllibacter halocynthiae]
MDGTDHGFAFGGANGALDRAAHLRGRDMAAAEGARVLALWRGKPLMSARGLEWVRPGHRLLDAAGPPAFLGLANGAPRLAAAVDWAPEEVPGTVGAFFDPSEQRHPDAPAGSAFAELRARMTALDPLEAELAAIARHLLEWHGTHSFCANCGAGTAVAQGGWQRNCAACGRHHFPRTDPVVIMLVLEGDDLLLGRSPGWPEGMYSCLAGFVEPGETLEAAVRREVHEETGVPVERVEVLRSQPWPFPGSLMIGCLGQAAGREIAADPAEIEDAVWITREEGLAVIGGLHPRIRAPRPGAIAGHLIRLWVEGRLPRGEWEAGRQRKARE